MPDTQFDSATFLWVEQNAQLANQVAAQLGISATAILGSIANEFNSRVTSPLTSPLGQAAQTFADRYAALRSTALNENYQALFGLSDNQLGGYSKFLNPVLIDVGPGNIRLRTAIELLDSYALNHPSDPLGLSGYRDNLALLVTDLTRGVEGGPSELSVKIAGLMVEQATSFFSQNAEQIWNAASAAERDALIVTYYKIGRDTVLTRLLESQQSGTPYEPSPGDGGTQHLLNATQLEQAYSTYLNGGAGDPPQAAQTIPTLVLSADQASSILGHTFVGSPVDVANLMDAISRGVLATEGYYFQPNDNTRFTAPLSTGESDRVVFSTEQSGWLGTVVRNGQIEHTLRAQTDGTYVKTDFDTDGSQTWSQQQTTTYWNGVLKEYAQITDDSLKSVETYLGELTLRETGLADAEGNFLGLTQKSVVALGQVFSGQNIGTILGSSLGQVIGGDNIFAQVAAGSVLSTLLGNVGQTFDLYFKDWGGGGTTSFDTAASAAFESFSPDLFNALRNQSVSAISSFLTGELAESMGFEGSSFGEQLLRAETGNLIGTVLTNLGQQIGILSNTTGSAFNIGSFVGTYLAHEIVAPENVGGSIGSALGSFLGTAVGTAIAGGTSIIGSIGGFILTSFGFAAAINTVSSAILGILLPGFGALFGTLLGTWLGNLFGGMFGGSEPLNGGGSLVLNPAGTRFTEYQSYGNNGDVANPLTGLRTATVTVLNQYLDAVGGRLAGGDSIYVNYDGYAANGSGVLKTVQFSYSNARDSSLNTSSSVADYGFTGQQIMKRGVINSLKHVQIAGGNLYMKRVLANSAATELDQLSGELKIAEDYGRYLAHKDIIDALIAQDPNSAFAAGWIVTLLRAQELGITQQDQSDFYGGMGAFLESFNVERFGATLADLSFAVEGSKLVILIPQSGGQALLRYEIDNFEAMTWLRPLSADPTGAPVTGGDNDDLWFAANGVSSTFVDDSLSSYYSNDVLIGSSGNDTITSGVGSDLVFGGAGNDVIDGGSGYDVIVGGAGNDTLTGGTQDDLAAFSGERADYAISYDESTNTFTITDQRTDSSDGTDTATGFETLRFSDTDINLFIGTTGAETLSGGLGRDWLLGRAGDDDLNGGAGNDILHGGAGNDTLDGGSDNDELRGGLGDDTYLFGVGSGSDTIDNSDGGVDRVVLGSGIWAWHVRFEKIGSDLRVSLEGALDTLTVKNWFLGANYQIGAFELANGSVVPVEPAILGTSGNDTLTGTSVGDVLKGLAGDDTYVVDNADDVVVERYVAPFVLPAGWTIKGTADFNNDGELDAVGDNLGRTETQIWLLHNGVIQSTVSFAESPSWPLAGIGDYNGDGHKDLLFRNWADSTFNYFIYLDGTTQTGDAEIQDQLRPVNPVALLPGFNEGTDLIRASVSYTLSHGVENLALVSGAGHINGTGNELSNTIIGNEGNNVLSGGFGDDALDGGSGDDQLRGGAGNDTYLFGVGSGSDTIDNSDGGVDRVVLGVGITASNVSFVKVGNDLRMLIDDTSDALTVANWFLGTSYQVGSFVLSDSSIVPVELATLGTAADDMLTGTISGDLIKGLAGNDTLAGLDGNDVLDGGTGADAMTGARGDDTFVVDDAGDVVTEIITASFVAPSGWTLKGTADFNNDGELDAIGHNSSHTEVRIWLLHYGAIQSTYSYTDATSWPLTGVGDFNGDGHKDILYRNAGNSTANYIIYLNGTTEIGSAELWNSGVKTPDPIQPLNGVNEGTDLVRSSISYVLPTAVENLTLTGNGNINGTGNTLDNTIVGNEGSNTLTGGSGNDTLNGGAGADTLIGGVGNDTYVVDDAGDVATENAGEGTDIVQTSLATYALGSNLENLVGTVGTGQSLTGNSLSNAITGGAANDTLDGGTGADTLIGGIGNDTYVVDNAADVVTESASEGTDTVRTSLASYTLGSNLENLVGTVDTGQTLSGNTLANTITGGSGNDTLDGGTGADTLIGGVGNDTYLVDDAGDVVTENASEGTDIVRTSLASYALGADVENLVGTAATGQTLTGNTLANTIITGAGNDTLDGGAGADTLIGGVGNDSYVVDDASDVVTENASEGADTVRTSLASYALGSNLENLIGTVGTGQTLTGNTLVNVITGGAGNDTLDGGTGADTLIGNLGDDTYVVDNASDVVTENADEGTDTVRTSLASYTLGLNLEKLVGIASTGQTLTGNALANEIMGDSGHDTLDGGTGADTLIGGAGNDTYIVDVTDDLVTENAAEGTDIVRTALSSYSLGVNVENLLGTSTTGQSLTGNSIANVITGGSGNDTIDGGAGADTLIGGAGDDTYVVDDVADAVTENVSAGVDTVRTALVSYALGGYVDNLIGTSSGGQALTGNTLANAITGGVGNDTIDGGTGADTLAGGLGNDIYFVDTASDVIIENANEGTDTVQSAATYTLNGNVENLTLMGTAAYSGTGNALDNVITGNSAVNTLTGGSGDDTLDGGAGADTLIGGLGNDLYLVDSASDVVTENASEGTDTVRTALVSYTLAGNVENLVGTLATGQTLIGNALINVINGDTGDDTLDGGSGADTLIGGLGNDTYVLDDAADVATENASEGADTVRTTLASYTLAGNIENLVGTSATGQTLTGNTMANTVTGGAGNDTIDGGIGADALIGGLGDDTFIVDDAGDVVTEKFSAAFVAPSGWTFKATGDFNNDGELDAIGHNASHTQVHMWLLHNGEIQSTISFTDAASWPLTGVGDFNGDGQEDILYRNAGNANRNYVVYLNGTTQIGDAELWNGVMTPDPVQPLTGANEGTDLVRSSISYTLSTAVENLTLINGVGNINGTGNTLDNVIIGNDGSNILSGDLGNDTLDGGAGADTLIGGAGNDSYRFGRGDGQDTVVNGVVGNAGPSGVLTFASDVDATELWFSQFGNDLRISILGSEDQITVSGWFGSNTAALQEIRAANGMELDNGVAQLVQAMATYSANNSGFNPTSTTQMPTDQNLQSAIAAAWH